MALTANFGIRTNLVLPPRSSRLSRVNGHVHTCRAINKPSLAGSLAMTYFNVLAILPAQAEELVDFGKGGNADPKSYFTVLALFLLSVPGKASTLFQHPCCAKTEQDLQMLIRLLLHGAASTEVWFERCNARLSRLRGPRRPEHFSD